MMKCPKCGGDLKVIKTSSYDTVIFRVRLCEAESCMCIVQTDETVTCITAGKVASTRHEPVASNHGAVVA